MYRNIRYYRVTTQAYWIAYFINIHVYTGIRISVVKSSSCTCMLFASRKNGYKKTHTHELGGDKSTMVNNFALKICITKFYSKLELHAHANISALKFCQAKIFSEVSNESESTLYETAVDNVNSLSTTRHSVSHVYDIVLTLLLTQHLKPFTIVVLNGEITVHSVDSPNGFEWYM